VAALLDLIDVTHRRRGAASGLAAGVLLAALAGCVGPAAPGSSPSAPAAQSTSAAPADVNSRAPEGLTTGGMVRLPIAAIPTQWNPWAVDGAGADASTVRGPLSSPAFLVDASGTARPNPDFLVSATASGTPTVATLRLNPLAVWGDGAAITAADWVATWTAVGRGDARFAARKVPGWDRVADVRQGADDHQVVITYLGVVPDWTQPLLAGPARAASVADPATFANWSTYRADWFAGPYVITHVDPANGLLTLEPNPRWWGTRPRLDQVLVRAVPAESVATTVAAGEFDLYSPGPDADRLAQARSAPGTVVRVTPGTGGRELVFSATGILADRRLRQAIVRGIDRAALARAAVGGLTPDPTVWSDHLLLPQQPGYLDAAEATGLTYDQRAAADALSAAGYALSGGVRVAGLGGQALVLTYEAPAGDTRGAAEASSVTHDLARLGIEVRTVASGGDIVAAEVDASAYPLLGVAGRFGGVPGLADLVAGMDASDDASVRQGQATQAARLLWQDARTLPLYVEPDVVVARNKLANAGATGFATTDWSAVGYTS
jgi:peptide/nickel transport system substrate-binding protein